MADFDEIGGLADYTAINTPAADDDSVGVFEVLGASFRQSTTIGSAFAQKPVQSVWDASLPVGSFIDNAFTEDEVAALPSVYQPFADRFVGVTKDGAKALRENIDGELRDRETLGRLGFAAGLASDIAVQFLDPVNYLPIAGTSFKGASLGAKLVKGAGAGVAGAALQEPVLFATQELRTGSEVKANLYASAAFGAVFGGAAHVVELAKAHWDGPRDTGARGVPLRSAEDIAPLKDEVHGHIKAALQGLGYEADAAGHNADISAAAYASLARRSGADPKALAEAFKAKVLGGDAPALGGLNQSTVDRGGRAMVAQVNADLVPPEVVLAPVALDRAGARAVALADRGAVVTADGLPVQITKAGVEKVYSGFVSDPKAALAPRLKEIVSSAVVYGEADGFKYGAARVTYDGKDVAMRLVFKMEGNKAKLYQIEGFEAPQTARPLPDGTVSALASGVAPPKNVSDLVAIFNGNDGGGRGFMQSAGPEAQPLYVVHNLSAQKLAHVVDLGGLAAPSLAIARGDIGFDAFGEISLIGDPAMADPKGKGVRAFSADVYSPRQPRARYRVNGKAARAVADAIRPVAERLGLEFGGDLDFEKEGLSAVSGEMAAKAAWLESVGLEVPIVREAPDEPLPVPGFTGFGATEAKDLWDDPAFVARVKRKFELMTAKYAADDERMVRARAVWLNEDGSINDDMLIRWASDVARQNREISAFKVKPQGVGRVSRYQTGIAIDAAIAGREAEFNGWVKDRFGDTIGDAFFASSAGRKMDYTLSNVVREMTRALRNGENWNYGAGNVRAAVAPEFKTLADIKAARGQIVDDAAVDRLKDEVNNELFALADKFAPFHPDGSRFGWGDTFSEFLRDMAKGPRAVAEWKSYFLRPIPDDLMAEAGAFLEKLKTLPTGYFEIKMQRAVQLSEFKAALVPEGASPEAVKALTDAGLQIVRYPSGGRSAALKSVSDRTFFQSEREFDAYAAIKAEADGLLAGLKDGGDLKEAFAASGKKIKARGELAKSLAANDGGVELRNDAGDRFAAVTTSQDVGGGWRVTYFGKSGFDGHTEYKTKLAAVQDALDQGFTTEAAGALRQAMKARTFFQSGPRSTDSPAFKKWFDGSKVVDADGKPLVVYHGTRADIDVFNADGGTGKTHGTGAFFSSNPETAGSYASQEGANIVPTYLSLKRPMVVDAKGKNWNRVGQSARVELPEIVAARRLDQEDENLLAELEGRAPVTLGATKKKARNTTVKKLFPGEFDYSDDTTSTDDLARWARNNGYDGLIINNVVDRGPGGAADRDAAAQVGSIYVAFDPAQIKSVNNGGAWDANDPRILHQDKPEAAPRGSIEFPPGGPLHGQAIIRLMGGADASTFMHESAHFFLEVMNDLHKAGGDKSAFADDIATIEAWAGARGADGRFGRDAHEKFARGFENYLRAGEAPSPALRRAFEAFKEWLVQLYATAARLNADVSPEMVKVYDRLLVPDVSEMPGAYPRSVGAAASGDMAMQDSESGEYRSLTASDFALRNRFARGVEASGVGLTPNNRAARAKVVGVKKLMADMVEDQRDTEASRQGAVTTAVETLIKNDRGMVEAKLYSIFGKKGDRIKHPTLPQAEFEERALNALANPDSEGDAMVRALADKVHKDVIMPLEAKMRDIGMLGKVQKWSQDGRYAPHNWSAGKIMADLPRFKKKMAQRIGDALRKGYQTALDKGDKRKTNLLREIDALEMSGLRRREEIARRMNGDEVNMTEEEIRALVMQARNKPDDKRPQSLRQFTVSRGGFWAGDPMVADLRAMEYRAVGFIKNERLRRTSAGDNNGGRAIDEMRELAEEAGFLPEGSSIDDLLAALAEDVAGRRKYSRDDLGEVQAWEAYDELLDSLAQMGFYFDGKPVLRKTTDSQKALMLKTIEALEKVDAADIAKLRAKVAEVEGEAIRSNDALNDAFTFDGEVDAILDEVVAKITKQDAVWAEDMSITIDRAGPLKRRSIDVMRNSFSEFMDNAALDAIGRHMHRMIAEYHLTKRFGRADMKHDLESLRAEAERYGESLTGDERIAFDKKMAADVAMIQTTRDQLRGTHAKGQVGFMAEAARFMSAASYTLQLGDVVTSSVSDAFRPVMAHGVGHLLRHGLGRLREGVKQAFVGLEEGDYLRSDRAGVVVERIASSRMMAMMDLEDEYHPNTKAARFSNNLAGLATRISIMDRWNQMGKWIASGLFMDRLGEMAGRGWDDLREADRAYLSINRISSHQWGYVSDMIAKNGTKERGIWSLNFERWADRDLAETVRAAMRKDTDSLIVTPGFGDRLQTLGGMDMTSPVGKMVLQYKSFWISGHERIMLRAAQNPDAAATASGALLMIVMGMMIDEVKAFTGNSGGGGEGYDFDKRWADRNFGTMVMGGIDRAGLIPMWMEANNMLERGLGLPLAYRAAGGLGMLVGAENVGDPSSRWASRNQLGSFLGPSAGVVQDAVRVVRDVAAEAQGADEGVSPGTVTAAKHLIPFQNAPVVRELLNWFLVPAAKAALEP